MRIGTTVFHELGPLFDNLTKNPPRQLTLKLFTRTRLSGKTVWLSCWQYHHAISGIWSLRHVFPLFPTWKVTLFTSHDSSRVHDVEQY